VRNINPALKTASTTEAHTSEKVITNTRSFSFIVCRENASAQSHTRTHTDYVGFLWMRDRLLAELLCATKQDSQQTEIHTPLRVLETIIPAKEQPQTHT